jgi:hypothetical protein
MIVTRAQSLSFLTVGALSILTLVSTPGCASKAQARTPAERPPLDAPPPPPRVIAAAPPEVTVDPGAATGTPASKPVTPPPSKPGTTAPPVAKPEIKPEPAKPAPTEAPRPDSTLGLLQTTPPENAAEAEKNIRALLGTVTQTLNRVDYRILKPDARAQYNTSKRFMQQAEDALKAKNFAFAQKLADKAAELARSLPGR